MDLAVQDMELAVQDMELAVQDMELAVQDMELAVQDIWRLCSESFRVVEVRSGRMQNAVRGSPGGGGRPWVATWAALQGCSRRRWR